MKKFKRFYVVVTLLLVAINSVSFVVMNDQFFNGRVVLGVTSGVLVVLLMLYFIFFTRKGVK